MLVAGGTSRTFVAIYSVNEHAVRMSLAHCANTACLCQRNAAVVIELGCGYTCTK